MSKRNQQPPTEPRLEMRATKGTAEILMYGNIGEYYGPVTAAEFARKLQAVGEIEKIKLRINSRGGDVFEGVAIFTTLRNHPAMVEVEVEGIAASIAAFIVQAGDVRRISDVSQFMVHPASGMSWGTADELEQYLRLLRNTDEIIRDLFAARSGADAEALAGLFSKDSYLTAKEALEWGFVDEITESVPQKDAKQATAHAEPSHATAPTPVVDISTARETFDRLAAIAQPGGPEPVTTKPAENTAAPKDPPAKPAKAATPQPAASPTAAAPAATPEPAPKPAAAPAPTPQPAPTNEQAEIAELCNRCGCPDKIGEYLRNQTPLETVRAQLLEREIANRKLTPAPTGDADQSPTPKKDDPRAKFEAEYDEASKTYAAMGLSKDQYVQSRMIDEGRAELVAASV